MRVLVISSPFLALQCVQSICHAPHRLRIVQLCPKKGVWSFQALNRQFYGQPPNFAGARRFLDEPLGRGEWGIESRAWQVN